MFYNFEVIVIFCASHPANISSPAFWGTPLRHTDLGHLSLRNYFCGAENAQDFLRRR